MLIGFILEMIVLVMFLFLQKNSLFASNVISAIDIREDTIPVIGFDAWLDYNLISVDQFENLNISMISPSLTYQRILYTIR